MLLVGDVSTMVVIFIPCYNYESENTPIFCVLHKEPEMVDVFNRRCQHDGCHTQPCYNYESENRPIFCLLHKEPEMIDVRNRRCQHDGCYTRPCYNYESENIPIFCLLHKEPEMVDVVNRRCQHDGCHTQPCYNYESENRPIFCLLHKEPEMIDVRNRRCQHDGCYTRPCYNYESENIPIFCVLHKEPEMVDVVSRKCQHDGCHTRPCYNYESETRPIFCVLHKDPVMVDVINRRCQHDGCHTIPSFNYESETRPIFCVLHKEPEMVNVVSRKCQHDGCHTQSTFGLLGNIPYHCAQHADKRVEIYRPTRRCIKCNELATHGVEYPVRCETHAILGDRTFEISKCSNCGLQAIINREGVCYCCDEFKNVHLAKQREIVAYLLAHNIPIHSVDKPIDEIIGSDCKKYRPDVVVKSKNGENLNIEVDEHQHENYQKSCELIRIKNIAEVSMTPTLNIRFNPDEYKTTDADEVPMKDRLIRLTQVIEECMNMERLPCTIGVIRMYFDGWIENSQ